MDLNREVSDIIKDKNYIQDAIETVQCEDLSLIDEKKQPPKLWDSRNIGTRIKDFFSKTLWRQSSQQKVAPRQETEEEEKEPSSRWQSSFDVSMDKKEEEYSSGEEEEDIMDPSEI